MNSPNEMSIALRKVLSRHVSPLKIRTNNPGCFEVAGTRSNMQGKQKVDGFYFASVVSKEKDVRLYYFPVNTHASLFDLFPELKKCLNGKSCFHFTLYEELEKEISEMVDIDLKIYTKDGLI